MEMNKVRGGSFVLSYPILSNSNYAVWAQKMKVFMQAQGVWCAVESSDSKATAKEKTDSKAIIEDKMNKIALAMINQGIPEDILHLVAERKTERETWKSIKILCQGVEHVKKARVQTLKADFESLSIKPTKLLDDFYIKLNGLMRKIRAFVKEMKESYVVKRLLRAVPEKFLQITSTTEQFSDLETMPVEEAMS
ncbi:hypothetical protein AgCh_030365 [Apium graveolens]